MRRIVIAFGLVTACRGERAPAPIATIAGDLVITDVTVVPMNRDGEVPHQSVIVRGDQIFAIAPRDRIEVGLGTTRIDGAGKWLMPGLADMHVHAWNEGDLTLFVAAGVTTVRNMWGSEMHLAWRDDITAGKRFGPTIVTASPILDGDPPIWPGSVAIAKPEDVDPLVAGLKAKGYDFLKPYSMLAKPTYEALVAAGKKYGLSLQGHVPRAVGLEEVVASGQRSIEHLDGWMQAMASPGDPGPPNQGFWKAARALLARVDDTRATRLAHAMKQAGVWNCPTLVVTDRMAGLDDVAAIEKRVRWLAYVTPEVRATWDPSRDFRLASADAEDFAGMREVNALRRRIVAVLGHTGAPLLVGTDTGNPFLVPGEAMHDEIELLVAAGVARPRVLRAATADAATFLGKPRVAGVVAAGARADLLLVAVDPLVTPLPLVPEGVVLRGTWLAKADLEVRLAALTPSTAARDRFAALPALAPEGLDVALAHYELRSGDAVVGEERLAAGVVDGHRVIVAQLVTDVPGRTEVSYRIARDATSLTARTPFGSLTLDGKVAGGKLVASGQDFAGEPVALDATFVKGAVFAGPGIGASVPLIAKLAGMKVGDRRTATSLELSYVPGASIETATYQLARNPDDAHGNRVFGIVATFGATTITSELVLDAGALPVEQRFGPPISMTFVRVP